MARSPLDTDAHRWVADPLPQNPLPAIREWLDEATQRAIKPNPNAMTLATIDPNGRPSARIVLLKGLVLDPGFVIFYTNRDSRKGAALAANPYAALILHWDHLDRQIRIEAPVSRSPDEESDRYFATRSTLSRLSAWASAQSRPIGTRDEMDRRMQEAADRLGVPLDSPDDARIPRPPHWGGYRVWCESVELWIGRTGRFHDRARWKRVLTRSGDGFSPGPWSAQRLQP